MTRAIIYARFSTDRQRETSIADQLRVCRARAKTEGWPIAGEYSDQGISGAALGNRPGAKRALAELQAGDVLLVMDLERLSRSQDLSPLIARIRHRGARVVGVQDHFDSDSRTARLQAGLSGIMSEEYRAMIAARTRSALEMRARAGERTGGGGYDDPEIVGEIFTRFAAGESMRSIASDLNRRGIPSPGATRARRSNPRGRWVVSALHSLLRNERYIGRVIWNRSQWIRDPDTGIRKRRQRPRSEWIVTECEPVVDPDTWARAQARFAARAGGGGKRRYLLSGLLVCAECGSKLIVMGGSQSRYACSGYKHGGEHACPNTATFPRKIAEERILAHVQERMLSPEAIAEGIRMLREERARAERPAESQADREVAELERMVREGLLSEEVAAPALEEARRRAKAARGVNRLPWPSEASWRAAVEGIRILLQGEDVDAAREALRNVLGSVRCVPIEHYVVAEVAERRVLLTGTGRSVDGMVAGARSLIYLPRSTRGLSGPDTAG